MDRQQIEDVFDSMGYYHLREKLPFKLWLSGVLNDEETGFLESFLETYSFEDDQGLLFDDFMFHLRIFKRIAGGDDW